MLNVRNDDDEGGVGTDERTRKIDDWEEEQTVDKEYFCAKCENVKVIKVGIVVILKKKYISNRYK